MDHVTKDGQSKLMRSCTYPQTGFGVVKTIFTDLAVIDIINETFVVRELASGISVEQLQSNTEAFLIFDKNWTELNPPELN